MLKYTYTLKIKVKNNEVLKYCTSKLKGKKKKKKKKKAYNYLFPNLLGIFFTGSNNRTETIEIELEFLEPKPLKSFCEFHLVSFHIYCDCFTFKVQKLLVNLIQASSLV